MEYLPGCLTSLIADNQLELPMFLGIAKVRDNHYPICPSLSDQSVTGYITGRGVSAPIK